VAISTREIRQADSVEEKEEQKQKQLADEPILIPTNKTPKTCAVPMQFLCSFTDKKLQCAVPVQFFRDKTKNNVG